MTTNKNVKSEAHQMSLSKSISVPQGIVLAICTIIGSGLLGLPGLAVEAGGGQAAALGWPVTMLISVPLVVVFLNLSLSVQNSGGVARYAAIALGGWAETAVTLILALTFMLCIPIGTFMGSAYLQKIFALPEASIFWIMAAVLIFSTVLNYLGIRPASWINISSSISLCILTVIIVGSHPDLFTDGIISYKKYFQEWRAIEFSGLWGVCSILFWAFLGWENLSFGSEEVKGGNRSIKAVFAFAFVIVTAIYAVLAIVATGAEAKGVNINGVSGLFALIETSPIGIVAYGLIVLVVVANVNAWVFAASRLVYSAGRAAILPRVLGDLPAAGIPRTSLTFMCCVYLVLGYLIYAGTFTISSGLALANQNFIVIYCAVIFCYFRLNSSFSARVVAAAAACSIVFLLSGFGWLLAVPLVIALAGYFVHLNRHVSDQSGRQEAA